MICFEGKSSFFQTFSLSHEKNTCPKLRDPLLYRISLTHSIIQFTPTSYICNWLVYTISMIQQMQNQLNHQLQLQLVMINQPQPPQGQPIQEPPQVQNIFQNIPPTRQQESNLFSRGTQNSAGSKPDEILRPTQNDSFHQKTRNFKTIGNECFEANKNNRNHHDISLRFKSRDDKYGGLEEEDLAEFITQYDTLAKDYRLSDEEKLQYFHNLFKREALRYFNTFVRNKATSK